MSKSGNAVASKAKAQFGNRLVAKDYQELQRKKSIAEVISYLKQHGGYADCFEGVSELDIRRGQFEMMIRSYIFKRYLDLVNFTACDTGRGIHFIEIYRNDISQIMMYLRSMGEEKYTLIANTNFKISKYSLVDYTKLIDATNYREFLSALSGTPYLPILSRFQPDEYGELDYTKIEMELLKYYYEEVDKLIKKYTHGQVKEKIQKIFNTIRETDNIKRIYRLKKYYHDSNEEIKKVLIPKFQKISRKRLETMIDTLNADDFISALQNGPYQLKTQVNETDNVENYIDRILYEMFKHYMYFESDPELILISYVYLMYQEVQNVIEIVEGIRYNANMDNVAKLLIY